MVNKRTNLKKRKQTANLICETTTFGNSVANKAKKRHFVVSKRARKRRRRKNEVVSKKWCWRVAV
jgi:hypothetical protein